MRALVHEVSAALGRCELLHLPRTPIDVARAAAQHAAYCRLLERCGVSVHRVAVSPAAPDAVFVEDTAVVLGDVIVATSMGAASRRGEVAALLPVLARFGRCERIQPPATLEGGDVLAVGRTLFTGVSARTNQAGVAALAKVAAPLGYAVVPVAVRGCLHLKTAVTALADDVVVANPDWVDLLPFRGMRQLLVHPSEPFAANVLRLGRHWLAAAAHPRTNAALAAAGHPVQTVDIDELQKAEAGMTCLSLLLPPGT